MEGTAKRLGLAAEYVMPAYEDPAHWLQKEAALPVNVDPSDSKLADAEERARMARVFDEGLNKPRGFVLPIQHTDADAQGSMKGWMSERWQLKRGHLFLIPGDSPLGLRLPMASLPHVPPEEYPYIVEQDPMEPRLELRLKRGRRGRQRAGKAGGEAETQAKAGADGDLGRNPRRRPVRVHAAGGEARRLSRTDRGGGGNRRGNAAPGSRRGLRAALRSARRSHQGDARSRRHRDQRPAGAKLARGRRHHLRPVRRRSQSPARRQPFSGRRPPHRHGRGQSCRGRRLDTADSPFLRRPDLLKSLVLYWQRHPSLSYLFSGMFIGPTSQAPRIDEARHDGLYELEVALAHVPPPDVEAPLWLVDRLFRHILVDITGNTHRAEICIDKLYSPDGPTGRLGLVEFRALEMPPDPRMSLAQQLLIRALIAKLWREPQQGKFVRWGTALHDRFMLPHFLWEDFLGVLDELRQSGYEFSQEWYSAQLEFRFPVFGRVHHGGVALELRQALEPWHVSAKRVGRRHRCMAIGSVERLQVKATGFVEGRHVVTCNSRRMPMTATGRSGEAVAAVRFKAWSRPRGCTRPSRSMPP